jgi:4-hydroxybenzoyl-CoA thioesterase
VAAASPAAPGPFRVTVPVRFADVDHAGIVYFPRLLHYFHIALEELFRARVAPGAFADLLDRRRIGLPTVHIEADFRRPLRFGQEVTVEVALASLGNRSVTLRYRAFPVTGGAPGAEHAAEAVITCAAIDLDKFRSQPLPPDLVELFRGLA